MFDLTYVLGAQYSILFELFWGVTLLKYTMLTGPTADENNCPPKVLGVFLNIDRL